MNATPQPYTRDSLLRFVGIPYEDKDCYELAQYFYSEILGIELEALYGHIRPSKKETHGLVRDLSTSIFFEVTKPEFGDIIVFKVLGLNSHIGIYIDDTHFLHSRINVGSALDRYGHWAKRIEGYYRCRK